MDVELGNRCPVCLDSWDDAAYVMPCLHQFCYGCILRWAGSKPECPLCKGRVQSIVHLVRADDDFEEVVIRPSGLAAASAGTRQAGGEPRHPATHSPPRPVTPQPRAVESVPRAPVGGLQPDTWASLFDDHPALLQRFLPWLQQQLGLLFAEEPSTAVVLEDLILSVLGLFGLDEEVLLRLLEVSLQNRTATFVRQLIDVAVQRCSGEAHRLLGLEDGHAAERREGSPTAAPPPAASQSGSPAPGPAPSGSPAGAGEVERPSTSTAALRGGPSSPPDAPVPTHGEQEELQEDPGEAAAACTARCSLATAAPKSLLLRGVTTCCCSLHQPRVTPCQGRSPKKSNKGKRKVLCLGRDNPRHQHMRRAAWLESSLAEKTLEVLVGTPPITSQQFALATRTTNSVLGCIRRSFASRSRKVILHLCLALLRPHLERCLQLWAPQYKREMYVLERVQQRAVEMSKALEHLSSEERLSELGLLSLVQRRLTGDLIDIEKGLKGGCKEDGVRLFPSGAWDRAWCPMTGEGILKSSLDMTLGKWL
ncbi:hypothetical protein QYF61_010861 [Mycteria americana]|uniref:E3 ubiquitin-protein ligase Topors n=1 Tax=Mycteria americana TaxID=33587 RepID=A0AAN7NRW9_MYCAM|nr:hypothetical protein QYF61_010861 [Mycteria americana]